MVVEGGWTAIRRCSSRSRARRLVFQLAEVTVSKEVFAAVLERIERLRCAYVRRANPVVA